MSGLDKKLFEKLPCNVGSQEYHDKVKVILKLLNEQINKFDLLFGKCDTTITEQYKEKLTKQKIIMECWLNDNITKAKLSCNHYFDEIIKTYNFSDFTTKCIDLTDDIIKIICDDIQIKLGEDISRLHNATTKNFGINIIHKLRSQLLVIYLEHNRNIADNTKSAQNILKDVLIIEDIINYDNIDIQVKFENQKFIKDTLGKINKIKPTISDEKFFTFNLEYNSKINTTISGKTFFTFGLGSSDWKINMINKKYCKIDDATYNKYYVDEVNKFFNEATVLEFYDVLVRRKIREYLKTTSVHWFSFPCNSEQVEEYKKIINQINNIAKANNNINFIFPRTNSSAYRYSRINTMHGEYIFARKLNTLFTQIFIEEDLKLIIDNEFIECDVKFNYNNFTKITYKMFDPDLYGIKILQPNISTITLFRVTQDNSFFYDKIEKFYKKKKMYEFECNFNKFIGLSETT
jgi:hypothetical protein